MLLYHHVLPDDFDDTFLYVYGAVQLPGAKSLASASDSASLSLRKVLGVLGGLSK